jgi:hypothetical protein
VRERRLRRRVVELRDDLRVRRVGDVEHDDAAVDVAEVLAVRPAREHVDVVQAAAAVEPVRRRERLGVA